MLDMGAVSYTHLIEYLKGLSQLKDFNLPMESYIYFKDNEIVEN